jgi:hypothetical protein
MDCEAEFEIYVHDLAIGPVLVDSLRYPQSAHSYTNNMDETKTFTYLKVITI